jgi:hypothetical protein
MKQSGQDLKTVQLAPSRPQPPSRKIMHQPAPVDGPHRRPTAGGGQTASNDIAADAVRIAKNPGSIDPRQMRD